MKESEVTKLFRLNIYFPQIILACPFPEGNRLAQIKHFCACSISWPAPAIPQQRYEKTRRRLWPSTQADHQGWPLKTLKRRARSG